MKIPREVYAIRHNVTKRVYIGSSSDVRNRLKNHVYSLRAGKHPVGRMQEDFDKYGEDYSFYIIDAIPTRREAWREYYWMARFGSYDKEKGYNYKDKGIRHKDLSRFKRIDLYSNDGEVRR